MTEAVREDLTAHAALRARTAPAHEAVDGAFGRFDLTEPGSYRRFLLAHAAVLPPLEAALAPDAAGLPPWRSRLDALRSDLAALGAAMPEPAAPAGMPAGDAALWGLLYVLEGSRLGGKMMARQVPPPLPSAFLGAGHLKGEWRGFLEALDTRAAAEDPAWLDQAVAGALFGFDAYRSAAAQG